MTRLAERPPGRYHPVPPRFRAASPSLRTASTSEPARDSVSGGSGPGGTAAPSAQRTDRNMTDAMNVEVTDLTPAETRAAAKATSEKRRSSCRRGGQRATMPTAPEETNTTAPSAGGEGIAEEAQGQETGSQGQGSQPPAQPTFEFAGRQTFDFVTGEWPARRTRAAAVAASIQFKETTREASVRSERFARILRTKIPDWAIREDIWLPRVRSPPQSQETPQEVALVPTSQEARPASTETALVLASQELTTSSLSVSEPPGSYEPSIMTRSKKRRADRSDSSYARLRSRRNGTAARHE